MRKALLILSLITLVGCESSHHHKPTLKLVCHDTNANGPDIEVTRPLSRQTVEDLELCFVSIHRVRDGGKHVYNQECFYNCDHEDEDPNKEIEGD